MTAPSILLLEHDATTRELILATLMEAGLRVTTTPPAPEKSDEVRVVVADLERPKGLGAELLGKLRKQYSYARVLAISGRFDIPPGAAASVARQIGADLVLPKPLDFRALLAHVRHLLAGDAP